MLQDAVEAAMRVMNYSELAQVMKEMPTPKDFNYGRPGNHRVQDFQRKWNHSHAQIKTVPMSHRTKTKTKGGKQKIHRYTGLLCCGDCGGSFTARICRQKDYTGRTKYMCLSYHRYGKDQCTSYRIREEELDRLINAELLEIRDRASKQW